MIASAATSTRSEREIASLVLGDIWVTLFGLRFAWSIRLGLFRACVYFAPSRRSYSQLLFQSGCVDCACSLQKFRMVPSPGMAAYPLPPANRQIKFFSNVTSRHGGCEKTQRFPGVAAATLNITTAFFQGRLSRSSFFRHRAVRFLAGQFRYSLRALSGALIRHLLRSWNS